ncbi:heat shock cognate 70 kDa protein 2-like protein [Tanacetum coccineum]|uniref:Heat shock cognate 70 kDa protein 2-like protein n=1 Tax=Tanacetum coccineum TaxID=301880 RepID=A0ABQ4XCF0_9ASTR
MAEDISSLILGKMKETAEAYLGEAVKDAVITVPAYFNNSQRKATKDAGSIVGLNIIRMINGPIAAAITYGLDNKKSGKLNVVVFDLGGGTFNVSLMTIEGGSRNNFKVIAVSGGTHLSGEDFDNRMVDYCVQEYFDEKELCKSVNPDEAVAYGAAIMATKLSARGRHSFVTWYKSIWKSSECCDSTEHSDTKKSMIYGTVHDYQSSATIRVYQGEKARCKDNHLLGKFTIYGFPPSQRMTLVEISFDIDANCILTVTAKVLSTGKTKKLIVTNENGRLSLEEIEKIVTNAKKYKHKDETFKEKEQDALHDCLPDGPVSTVDELHHMKWFKKKVNALEDHLYHMKNKFKGHKFIKKKANALQDSLNRIKAKIKAHDFKKITDASEDYIISGLKMRQVLIIRGSLKSDKSKDQSTLLQEDNNALEDCLYRTKHKFKERVLKKRVPPKSLKTLLSSRCSCLIRSKV